MSKGPWVANETPEQARERRRGYTHKAITKVYRRWSNGKCTAAVREISWNITHEQLATLLVLPCYYCSQSIANETGSGLDRVDQKRGYEIDNVVPCCHSCNYKKGCLEKCGFEGLRLLELVREAPRTVLFKNRYRG